ncbi:uncharacterized protein LOC110751703 [Prunus avium]|uniref:Uncharacterized protein LOC110751703 n=1 Tax=Prunus avium TaxID=42229 RepID=A0A6P5S369_PRUAV|nr:uncharacterized protein LOC110751703 [Prunus avium]
MPKAEELRGNKDCKLHDSYSHSTNDCVQFRDIVQDMIVKGDITLEKPAPTMVDSNPFPNMHVNMVEINWPDRGKRKLIVDIGEEGNRIVTLKQLERSKASIVAGVVSCSKCKMECDFEIP